MADKWIQLMSEDGTDNLFPTTKMDLLWENASPLSSFPAQTISMDLSGYEMLLVLASNKYGYDVSCLFTNTIIKNVPGKIQDTPIGISNVFDTREISFDTTKIEIGNAYHSSYSSNPDVCIPVKIYGIK